MKKRKNTSCRSTFAKREVCDALVLESIASYWFCHLRWHTCILMMMYILMSVNANSSVHVLCSVNYVQNA